MVQAIQVKQNGGPEALTLSDIDLPAPGPGQVRLRHTAIGVNYIDTYFRTGLYPMALPFIPGSEAAGIIEAVGDDVTGLKVGDRVGYCSRLGAYAQSRLIDTEMLIPLPDTISDEVAAAGLLKGLTAQYLLRQTFKVGAEHLILFHAAAGGVGLIAGQWAKHLGAKVIGTAGSADKVELALQLGYDHVINYRQDDFVVKFLELTGGRKADVVYDSVGKDTFPASLDIIKPLGLFVSFGQSSGPVPPFNIGLLNTKGSLYMTRPSLFAYNGTRDRLMSSANEMFGLITAGVITIPIHQRFALSEARAAHEALESRKTTGATILIP